MSHSVLSCQIVNNFLPDIIYTFCWLVNMVATNYFQIFSINQFEFSFCCAISKFTKKNCEKVSKF